MALSVARCPSSSAAVDSLRSSALLGPVPRRVLAGRVASPSAIRWKLRVTCKQEASSAPMPTAKETPSKNVENGGVFDLPSQEYGHVMSSDPSDGEPTVSITVVGASGDLAKKKIFPALFALYYEDCLPKHFTIFGYARSKMTDAELRTMVSRTLTCRIDKRENCNEKMEQFLKRCFYHSGQYDLEENFAELDKKLKVHEVGYLSTEIRSTLADFDPTRPIIMD